MANHGRSELVPKAISGFREHGLGSCRKVDGAAFGREPRDWLLQSDFIPDDLRAAWTSAASQALEGVALIMAVYLTISLAISAAMNIPAPAKRSSNKLWRRCFCLPVVHFL